jgi:hypothetical protein
MKETVFLYGLLFLAGLLAAAVAYIVFRIGRRIWKGAGK